MKRRGLPAQEIADDLNVNECSFQPMIISSPKNTVSLFAFMLSSMSSKDEKPPCVTQPPIEMHPTNLPPPGTAAPAGTSRVITAIAIRQPKGQSVLINLRCSWSSQVIRNCPFFADNGVDELLETFRRFFISFPPNPGWIKFYCNSRLLNWSLDTTIADADIRSGETVCMVVPKHSTGPGISCLLLGLQFANRYLFAPNPAFFSYGCPSQQYPKPWGNHSFAASSISSKDQKTPSVTQLPVETHPSNLPPPGTAASTLRAAAAVITRPSKVQPDQQWFSQWVSLDFTLIHASPSYEDPVSSGNHSVAESTTKGGVPAATSTILVSSSLKKRVA